MFSGLGCGGGARLQQRRVDLGAGQPASPVGRQREQARAVGQRLVTLTTPRRDVPWLLPGTKSTSYAVNMAAEAEALIREGAIDHLVVPNVNRSALNSFAAIALD